MGWEGYTGYKPRVNWGLVNMEGPGSTGDDNVFVSP